MIEEVLHTSQERNMSFSLEGSVMTLLLNILRSKHSKLNSTQ